MRDFKFARFVLYLAAIAVCLSGCSPTYDWREVQGTDAPYTAMLPAKPSTYSRPVNLNGIQVTMTMTATRVKNASFAIGSAPITAPGQAAPALQAMKTAMVNNIGGTLKKEVRLPAEQSQVQPIEIEATGKAPGGQPVTLFARFIARNEQVYQVVVLGPDQDVPREEVEMFFSSFKPR